MVTLPSAHLVPFSFAFKDASSTLLFNPALLFWALPSSVGRLAAELLGCVSVITFYTFF